MVAGVALIPLIAVLGPTAFLARSVQIPVSPLHSQKMENGSAQIVIANWRQVRLKLSFNVVETNGIIKSG